jgi:hypothetical protein
MKLAYLVLVLALAGCSTVRPAPSGSSPVDVQRTLLEEQSATLDGMRADVAGIKAGLESSRAALEKALAGTGDLVAQFNAIDVFVRAVIAAEKRLETLQNGGGVK